MVESNFSHRNRKSRKLSSQGRERVNSFGTQTTRGQVEPIIGSVVQTETIPSCKKEIRKIKPKTVDPSELSKPYKPVKIREDGIINSIRDLIKIGFGGVKMVTRGVVFVGATMAATIIITAALTIGSVIYIYNNWKNLKKDNEKK